MYYIQAFDIEDGWRQALNLCVSKGYMYTIKKGSYEEQKRVQLPYLVLDITNQKSSNLGVTLPEHLIMPPPSSHMSVQHYFANYLMLDTKSTNEDYRYGQYIAPQIDRIIELLNQSEGKTNQACITVGDNNSINLTDPPCMKLIDFKLFDNKLHLYTFFRSWDLYAGLPMNLGGLFLLRDYVLMHLDFECDPGSLTAFSSGAHIYEQYFELVNQLCVSKIRI